LDLRYGVIAAPHRELIIAIKRRHVLFERLKPMRVAGAEPAAEHRGSDITGAGVGAYRRDRQVLRLQYRSPRSAGSTKCMSKSITLNPLFAIAAPVFHLKVPMQNGR